MSKELKMSDVFEYGLCLEVSSGHIINRYDEFTEVQANAIEDAVSEHDKHIAEIAELREALMDAIDGYPDYDLVDRTGLSLDRCKEIWRIAKGE
ncbi:coil containing protein [Vibrio phage 1.133.O._10N.222.51.E4]|nr:coil containing protein [Vibrio phage 1.133.O._10N.222.51.E4]